MTSARTRPNGPDRLGFPRSTRGWQFGPRQEASSSPLGVRFRLGTSWGACVQLSGLLAYASRRGRITMESGGGSVYHKKRKQTILQNLHNLHFCPLIQLKTLAVRL